MKTCEVWMETVCCAAPVRIADHFLSRFRGLMLRKALRPKEGLLLKDCPMIHCCFMRFPIDAVYLDDSMTVVGVETVYPWQLGHHFTGARHVLELEMGRGSWLRPGMHLLMKEGKQE